MVKFWEGLVVGAVIGVAIGIFGTVVAMKATKDREFDEEHEEELAEHMDAMNRDIARKGATDISRHEAINVSDSALSSFDDEAECFDPDVLTPMKASIKPSAFEYEGARTFIITREEFDSPFEEFEKFEVDYDITNDILYDEAGDPVPVEVLASKPIIDRFYDANGCNTVYIRNMGLDLDYRITKVDGHGNMVSFRPRTSEEEYEAIEEAEVAKKEGVD
jgi:hypothetical protein